jgi:hypothetical protein
MSGKPIKDENASTDSISLIASDLDQVKVIHPARDVAVPLDIGWTTDPKPPAPRRAAQGSTRAAPNNYARWRRSDCRIANRPP